jgi:hypothetical protein
VCPTSPIGVPANALAFQCSNTSLVNDKCVATCKLGFAAGATGAPTVTCTATTGTAVWSAASGTCVQGETMASVTVPHGNLDGALRPYDGHLKLQWGHSDHPEVTHGPLLNRRREPGF